MPPYTTKELEQFVADMGLSDDKKKLMLDAIGSDAATLEKFGAATMRQSEFSSKMNSLGEERTKLEKEYKERLAKEDQFFESTKTWKADAEKDVQKRIADTEAKLAANAAEVKNLAEKYGIPEAEVTKVLAAAPSAPRSAAPERDPETGKWITKDEFRKEGVSYAKLIPIVMDLQEQHKELFGGRLDTEALMDEATRTGTPLRALWEKKYEVGKKREEIRDTKHKSDVESAEKRGADAARSKVYAEHPELQNRGNGDRERPGSPILGAARKQEKNGPPAARTVHEGVTSAVKAFNDGRYKGGVDHNTAA